MATDLASGEVAEALGIATNTADVRLHRTRKALKTLLEKKEDEGAAPTATV